MRSLFICLFLGLLWGCHKGTQKPIRIGVDPNWTEINAYGQEKKINGFLEELLKDLAEQSGETFMRVGVNWDTLYQDLEQGRVDLLISSLPSYNFNSARFSFSKNILDLGPVFLVPLSSSNKMGDRSGQRIGWISNEQNALLSINISEGILHEYPSVPLLLESLSQNEIDAALLDRLLAVSFVQNLYGGVLKIVEPPLNEFGLHFVALKKEEKKRIAQLNKALEKLHKKKTLQALQEKWGV